MSQELVRATPVTLVTTSGQPTLLSWLLKGGFFLAVLGGTYFIVRKIILEIRRRKLLGDAGTNSPDGRAIGYANRLYAAMFRGNTEWWNDVFGDGTDEEGIFQVAREMNSSGATLGDVAAKYKVLYDRELLQDITRELDPADNAKFQAIISTGLGNLLPPPTVISHRLNTTKNTPIFDEQLQLLGEAYARTGLGEHLETIFTQGHLGALHGFSYKGKMRYVPTGAVTLVKI